MREALSLDLDGPIIQRPPFQVGPLLYGEEIFNRPAEIPVVNRTISNSPLNLLELVSLMVQSRRHVNPEAVELLSQLDGQCGIFGNTGRPYNYSWVGITERTLKKGGIFGYFHGLFFTPSGVRRLASKADALRRILEDGYERVKHVDDDPNTILGLDATFRDSRNVSLFLLRDLSTGIFLSRVNMANYPKVRIIRSLQEILRKD